jgi:hypothetical protein
MQDRQLGNAKDNAPITRDALSTVGWCDLTAIIIIIIIMTI